MSTATVRAYRSDFTGRIAPARSCKNPEIKPFYGRWTAYSGEAHCIKDRVLLDPACGSGGMFVHVDILEEDDSKLRIFVRHK